MGWVPPPPPPISPRPAELARRAVEAAKLKRQPWRDPASEHYDPLRVIKQQRGWLLAAPALCVLLLTACATQAPQVITRPVYIERVRNVVQPTPPALLTEHPIASGAPSQCLDVAAQRREQLQACNADKAALRGLLEPVREQ